MNRAFYVLVLLIRRSCFCVFLSPIQVLEEKRAVLAEALEEHKVAVSRKDAVAGKTGPCRKMQAAWNWWPKMPSVWPEEIIFDVNRSNRVEKEQK